MKLAHPGSAFLLVVLFGCSSDVQTLGGGDTGAGSQGGQNVGAGNTNGGSTNIGAMGQGGAGNNTTVSTGGGGGALPGTPCEQLCSTIQMCFGQDCAALGVNCGDPQVDCPATCLQGATCADLAAIVQGNVPPQYAGCLAMCQGGTGGGGTGGGAQGNCQQCAFGNNCLDGCFQDQACQAWAQCAMNCQDPACFSACNAANPDAAMSYTGIYSCMCTNCDMACGASVDPCNQM